MDWTDTLRARSEICELCGSDADLLVTEVPPQTDPSPDRAILTCAVCAAGIAGDPVPDGHWSCLQGAIWSEVPAVQVVAWRLAKRSASETWAADLLDQAYLDEPVLAWAQQGGHEVEDAVRTVDSNGTELLDGDSVTLIKDLDVKGGGFTAKRGTLVKGIRLTGDPTHIEGRVNKTAIYLKTEFLKKA